MGINKVILVGHLGRDSELRHTVDGATVCNMSLATSEKWRDRNEQPQERAEWHRIVAWHGIAENCAKYLRKGSPCCVEGKLQTFSWIDKEGAKRYTTKIVASRVVFLSSGQGGRHAAHHENESDAPSSYTQQLKSDDDIPF